MLDARTRYVSDAVTTASPGRLLTMLYDRLLLDLDRAHDALAAGDRTAAGPCLDHAADVISELMGTLNTDVWDGAERLMALYDWALAELFHVRASGDAERVSGCRRVLEPLALAWHEAADEVGRLAVPAQAGDPADGGVLGVG